MSAFNKLSNSQVERLALLAEECAEVIHIVGKILRHGYYSVNPNLNDEKTNKELLEQELGDLMYAKILMERAGDIESKQIICAIYKKMERLNKYLHHNSVTT